MTDKPQYTHNNREYRPEEGLTFRAVEINARKEYFEDLLGYEGCLLEIFYGPEKEYDHRIFLSSDKPDDFLRWLLSSCQMNLWLGTSIDFDLIDRFKETENGAAIKTLLNSIYDLPHDDIDQLAAVCYELTYSYSDFLIEIAADIFKGGVRGQLAWFAAVNEFEDNNMLTKTPLKTIGAQCVKNLIEQSRENRAAETARAAGISPDYALALKKANEFMDDCARCYEDGVEFFDETIRSMHPGVLSSYMKAIDDRFPLAFMDSLEAKAALPI